MSDITVADCRNPSPPPPEVMIFGSGACARRIAANLGRHGIHTRLAARQTPSAAAVRRDDQHGLAGVVLTACRGFAGNFRLTLKRADQILHRDASAIVVAEDDQCIPSYTSYGLQPHPQILTLAGLEEKLVDSTIEAVFEPGTRIAFLGGWRPDGHPVVVRRMLEWCGRLQYPSQVTTYFLAGNLKVSAWGAEERVQAAKRAGAVFLKFTRVFPAVHLQADGRFRIEGLDEATRTAFRFEVDWLIVDEAIGPHPGLKALAKGLAIDLDDTGFAQRDNVRRLSHATNRRGVFAAGGSRGVFSPDEQLADADRVSFSILTFLRNLEARSLPRVDIHRGRCARCLTCHRLCPHRAVEIGPRISIVTAACRSCGICVAGCPAHAIEMEGMLSGGRLLRKMHNKAAPAENTAERTPQVAVFGCARSAGRAHALIRLSGRSLPAGVRFIEVPCGGAISGHDLLAVFAAGIDGAMLCTCHIDNCESEIGNRLACRRADAVRDLLVEAGEDGDRLHVASVAANMGSELAFMIEAFVDRIAALEHGAIGKSDTTDGFVNQGSSILKHEQGHASPAGAVFKPLEGQPVEGNPP